MAKWFPPPKLNSKCLLLRFTAIDSCAIPPWIWERSSCRKLSSLGRNQFWLRFFMCLTISSFGCAGKKKGFPSPLHLITCTVDNCCGFWQCWAIISDGTGVAQHPLPNACGFYPTPRNVQTQAESLEDLFGLLHTPSLGENADYTTEQTALLSQRSLCILMCQWI